MFERLLFTILDEAVTALVTPDATGGFRKLKHALKAPGRDAEEIQKLADYFVGDGKPGIRHGYAQGGPPMPCYSITLGGENADPEYLGARMGGATTPAVKAFVAEVEAIVGKPVDVFADKVAVNYDIWVYTKKPDVCIAYSHILRDTMVSARRRLIREGLDLMSWRLQDVVPDQRYLPADIFVRQFAIQGVTHLLSSGDIDLGPFATARGTKVGRVHVANHVTGVNPGVTPVED